MGQLEPGNLALPCHTTRLIFFASANLCSSSRTSPLERIRRAAPTPALPSPSANANAQRGSGTISRNHPCHPDPAPPDPRGCALTRTVPCSHPGSAISLASLSASGGVLHDRRSRAEVCILHRLLQALDQVLPEIIRLQVPPSAATLWLSPPLCWFWQGLVARNHQRPTRFPCHAANAGKRPNISLNSRELGLCMPNITLIYLGLRRTFDHDHLILRANPAQCFPQPPCSPQSRCPPQST